MVHKQNNRRWSDLFCFSWGRRACWKVDGVVGDPKKTSDCDVNQTPDSPQTRGLTKYDIQVADGSCHPFLWSRRVHGSESFSFSFFPGPNSRPNSMRKLTLSAGFNMYTPPKKTLLVTSRPEYQIGKPMGELSCRLPSLLVLCKALTDDGTTSRYARDEGRSLISRALYTQVHTISEHRSSQARRSFTTRVACMEHVLLVACPALPWEQQSWHPGYFCTDTARRRRKIDKTPD